ADKDEADVRRALRDLTQQWKQKARGADPALRGLETRFAKAKTAVDAALSMRARTRESAIWKTLAAKERQCEALDGSVISREGVADAAQADGQWSALPALSGAWEKAMLARRDAALGALADEAAAGAYRARIESNSESRREMLLELEMELGIESPPELK